MPQRFVPGAVLGLLIRLAGESRGAKEVVARAVASTVESLESRVLLSTYFVSTGGSDTHAGSIASPFRTIQRAANLANPGDTILIRGGTYRETVTPARSGSSGAPIVFKPYNGEKVVVSGADPVGDWSRYSGSIYKATQSWTLGDGANQIFVDGQMMNEARWPNTSLDISHQSKMSADSVSGGSSATNVYDSALTQATGYWTGATVHIAPGQGWVVQTGKVSSSAPGRITYSAPRMSSWENPTGGDPYYLTGKFKALDAPTEWYRDPSGALYLWTARSDSPSSHVVEAKHRQFAFNLNGKSNITIDGVGIFAANITTNSSSNNVVINHITAKYLSHYTWFPSGWSQPGNTGIILNGSNSAVLNSNLGPSSGDGVFLGGTNNRVENTVIHDVDYAGTDTAPIRVLGRNATMRNNTIYNAARSGIKFSHATGVHILSNTIHDVMLQTTDGGGVYTYGTNGSGSEIAYNRIYNVQAGGFGASGIFIDNNCSSYLIHHNVVSNATNALKLNPSSYNNRVYNNTLAGTKFSLDGRSMNGTIFKNNIFIGGKANFSGTVIQQNNILPGTSAGLTSSFTLTSGSTAINRGTVVSPITNGYVGSAPDIGAFEFGRTAFGSGANLSVASGTLPPPTPAPDTTPPPAPSPTGTRSARSTIAAISFSAGSGVRSDGYWLGYLNGGDWAKYSGINFGAGVSRFVVRLALANSAAGGRIEIRVGSPTGRTADTLTTKGTGGWTREATQSTGVTGLTGVQDIFLVFQGGDGIANIRNFSFA